MIKWAVELSEHDIEFQSRLAIKPQILVDFISKIVGREDDMQHQVWKIFVDGSSTSTGSGVGIVIKSSKADSMKYAITLEFPTSNNDAEYEAILLGSKLIHVAGAKEYMLSATPNW
ncbi:UNVERIFIED_CONTAM: hypothetical protein Slati_1450900 [Sesamum latifolium]|uniref:RNase H type-1 domain-containing protein n=1 Tax=Sesamum latifolium TaxID=2727402 RepID=A0AAW2X4E9_9LAMI